MLHRAMVLALAVAAALAVATPAAASVSNDVAAGRALAAQLRAGTTTCDDLSTGDYRQLGEYVMGRMTGSVGLHAAMDDRMRSVMGPDNDLRMHALMGERYAGCARGNVGGMGPGMMGRSWTDDRTWGAMMNSDAWSWMRDGNWQHMSRADWQRVADRWMGPGMMATAHDGWDTGDTVLVVIAVLLAAGLLTALLAWKPWHPQRPGTVAH